MRVFVSYFCNNNDKIHNIKIMSFFITFPEPGYPHEEFKE